MCWSTVTIVISVLLLILLLASCYIWAKIDAGVDRRPFAVGPCRSFVIKPMPRAPRVLASAILKIYVWRYNLHS